MSERAKRPLTTPWRWAAVLLVAVLVAACGQSASNDAFGNPEQGRRVYDRSGTLGAPEVRSLEARAERVAEAGAPVVVYLRVRDASYEETERDASALMEAWDVQSGQDRRDGVVIFLNLKPGDTRHGQVALFAGQRHYQGGNLPERELRRIFEGEMRPLLADGQLAAGIGVGLDELAQSLAYGPPQPAPLSPQRRAVGDFARLPLNVLAAMAAGVLALLAWPIWRGRPSRDAARSLTTVRPGDLSPALAGALVAGRVQATQLAEATLLDLARRGALVMEPAGRRSVQVRPLNGAAASAPHEQQLWSLLAGAAAADGTVSAKALGRLRSRYRPFAAALQAELVGRGWYDPAAASRRRPLYAAGIAAFAAAAGSAALAAIGQEPWGLLAAGLLAASGLLLVILGYAYPATTDEGERVAAPWRAYRAGLSRAARHGTDPLDLETALPDAVALGTVTALNRRLKEASAAGYAPSWFVQVRAQGRAAGFYPVWVAFHGSVAPSSSSGGGASSGGGGAGGGF